ncbi:hypothetical protein CDCA_CDCA06G1750 [Cyanidium caldarium]|uniref:Uncharacterized protein n=1 Tax=Cyanidium caldarium TaxID=2771 RepID=A0AAV9IUD1_CYACA|nr:hypothetical protein CDCA_CDCA06G1750 [Cyanidium caldarium]
MGFHWKRWRALSRWRERVTHLTIVYMCVVLVAFDVVQAGRRARKPRSALGWRRWEEALSLDQPGWCVGVLGNGERPRSDDLQRLFAVKERRRWDGLFYMRAVGVEHLRRRRGQLAANATGAPVRHPGLGRVTSFGNLRSEDLNGRHAASISHLLMLHTARERHCQHLLVLEDDMSLSLIPLWEMPVAQLAAQQLVAPWTAMQLEVKIIAFRDEGHSGGLQLERAPLNCAQRHWIPHQCMVTWGTGAYVMNAAGMWAVLRHFQVLGRRHIISMERVARTAFAADMGLLFAGHNTKVLWPPYFFEIPGSSSTVRDAAAHRSHEGTHLASAEHAIAANVQRAGACALQGYRYGSVGRGRM